MKVVLATKNIGKLAELKELAASQTEIQFVLAPAEFDPPETANTFVGNAIIKALEAARTTGLYALADDSGLAVDALGGAPGIYSARYCDGTDADRRNKLLKELQREKNRAAAFVCAMALVSPAGDILHTCEMKWHGEIGFEAQGQNGFGYDPIFILPIKGKTAAQLSSEEKNEISHRAQAWKDMMQYLQTVAL